MRQLHQGVGECRRITSSDEPRQAVGDELGKSATVGDHDRSPDRLCLQCDQAEGLFGRWDDDGVDRSDCHHDVVGAAGECVPAGQPSLRVSAHLVEVGAGAGPRCADDSEVGVDILLSSTGNGIHGDLDTLAGIDPTDHRHQEPFRVAVGQPSTQNAVCGSRTESIDIDTLVDDGGLGTRPWTELLAHGPADRDRMAREDHRAAEDTTTDTGRDDVVQFDDHGPSGDPAGHGGVDVTEQPIRVQDVASAGSRRQEANRSRRSWPLPRHRGHRRAPPIRRIAEPAPGREGDRAIVDALARPPALGRGAAGSGDHDIDVAIPKRADQVPEAVIGPARLVRERRSENSEHAARSDTSAGIPAVLPPPILWWAKIINHRAPRGSRCACRGQTTEEEPLTVAGGPGATRVSNLDVARAGSWSLIGHGPVDHGGPDAVTAALCRLGRAGPSGRIGLVADHRSTRWRFDPSLLEQCVVDLPATADRPLTDVMTELARERPADLPIWVAISGDRVISFNDHGVGDGRLTIDLAVALSSPNHHVAPGHQDDARSCREFVPPSVRALRHVRIRSVLTASRERARADTGAEEETDNRRPFTPSPTVCYRRGTREPMTELRSWRERFAPDATATSLMMAAKVRALREVGFDPLPTVHVLFDCRRYVPEDRRPLSNFVAGVDLAVIDPGDPVELSAAIQECARSGRPAAVLAATVASTLAHRLLRTSPAAPPQTVADSARPRLSLSDLGSVPQLEAINWADSGDSDQRSFVMAVDTAGPEALSMSSLRVAGGASDSASFHDTVFPRETVDEALRRAVEEPVRLLASPRLRGRDDRRRSS